MIIDFIDAKVNIIDLTYDNNGVIFVTNYKNIMI